MKKVILSLSILIIFGLVNCGGDNKEAKELLQRILNLVGIPQDIVVNICQNDNKNSVCDAFELQAKIHINKKDKIYDILSKITQTEEGEYLLETFDPTKPLLLELKDIVNVKYDNGKFSFNFNGLTDNELNKELSIFQTMIDSNNLTVENVKKARALNRKEDQDKFYTMLLNRLEKNLTPLRDRLAQPQISPESSTLSKSNTNTDAEQAMHDNLIEMSRILLANGIENEFPNRINACNGDTTCVDNNLNLLDKNLTITPERAKAIYPLEDSNNTNSENNTTTVSSNNFAVPAGAFITTWKTDNQGISKSNQITIPTNGDGYNYSIDWGDGTHDVNLTSDKTHTYSSAGEYTISIFGKFPQIAFGKNSDGRFSTIENDARKLISIVKWGDNRWTSMEKAFMECTSFNGGASDKPDLSNVTTTNSMFYGALAFHDSIGDWDVSNITNMNSMFKYARNFNKDISNWDVSHVTDMSSMFQNAEKFNQDIGGWSIINVKSMKDMFSGVTLSGDIYDKILIGWNNQPVEPYVYFDGGDSIYGCDAKEARDNLINSHKWTIYDGGSSCDQHHQQEPYYD